MGFSAFWKKRKTVTEVLIILGYQDLKRSWYLKSHNCAPDIIIPKYNSESFQSIEQFMLGIAWSPKTPRYKRLSYYMAWNDILKAR